MKSQKSPHTGEINTSFSNNVHHTSLIYIYFFFCVIFQIAFKNAFILTCSRTRDTGGVRREWERRLPVRLERDGDHVEDVLIRSVPFTHARRLLGHTVVTFSPMELLLKKSVPVLTSQQL